MASAQPHPSPASAGEAAAGAAPAAAPPVRVEHYQSASHVTVTVFVKGADAARTTAAVGADGSDLLVSIPLSVGGTVEARFALHGAVEPSPAVAVRATAVEVRLAKAPGAAYAWPALERAAGAAAVGVAAAAAPAGAAAPSAAARAAEAAAGGAPPAAASSLPAPAPSAEGAGGPGGGGGGGAPAPPKKKDWDRVAAAELADEGAPEGEEALMKLFKSIYANGDETTRMAMVKSFQTSGGTVLSTNWSEVAKTDYEKDVRPPEGQVAKKWES